MERKDALSRREPVAASTDADNEELSGGRLALLFEAGSMAAVTLDGDQSRLPELPDGEPWRLVRRFVLGIRDPGLEGVSPEPVIRGLLAHGVYCWDRSDPSRTTSTSQ